jgi:hypothetical protein
MLFEVRPNLRQSEVFAGLHCFLHETMLATLEDRQIDETHLPDGLCAAIHENPPTREVLETLTEALTALAQEQRQALRNALAQNIDPCTFLIDRGTPPPVIPETVFAPLKKVAIHLFQRTAKLKPVEEACGECVDDHYARFRQINAPGNGNVCCVCGTQYLAQIQSGLDENEQWRGPYDHLLAKDAYPLFGVHPRNLLPICDTCNSKAKLAKDLLLKNDLRRLSFLPWSEHALPAEIQVSIDETAGLLPRVMVNLISLDSDRQEKLTTWDDVYNIKARIEGEFTDLREKIAEDVSVSNEATFLISLEEQTRSKFVASRRTPFSYWRSRVYCALLTMPNQSREAFRQAIVDSGPNPAEMDDLFFGQP